MAGNPINPTPRVKQVLLLARREAERFNHPHIGTEHLLYSIFDEKDCIATFGVFVGLHD